MKKILFFTIVLFNYVVFAKEYYVSSNGNNNNDGLAEATAWRTITYAATKLNSGDTVWIKAGNYGNENVVIKNSGIKGMPISFIGYKNTPGDITSMYYSYSKGKPLDPKEMPMLDGGNRGKVANGMDLAKQTFIIIKNLQITNYSVLIKGIGNNLLLENILGKSAGGYDAVTAKEGSGYGFLFANDDSYNNVFKDCIVINATSVNFRVYGSNNVIDGCESYCDEGASNDNTGIHAATDYYIVIRGSNNTIKNTLVKRVGNLSHTGHGISMKSKGIKTENNLIENCTIVNVKGAIELRHSDVQNNIIRDVTIKGPLGAVVIRDGASNNIIENSMIKNTNGGIRFYDQTEDGQGGIVASNNLIRNSVFQNINTAIVATKSSNVSKIGVVKNNNIENCTFNNIENLFLGSLPMDETNNMVNNIFNNIKNYEHNSSKYPAKWVNTYNNYFNNGFSKPSGNRNISVDPKFEDISKSNFRLKSTSKLIDAGKNSTNVTKDCDGNARPQGESHDIGAFEYIDGTTGSVQADAGSDVTINEGDSVTLTASGGGTYKWTNGQTTASITVSPTATKIYTVTVTKDNFEDTDSVKVTVNSATVSINANAGDDVFICSGENTTLIASGGSSYTWSTGATTKSITVSPSATQTYTVTVSEGTSFDSDEVMVTVNSVTASAGSDRTIQEGEIVKLTANGGDSYIWNTGATTKSISVSPNSTKNYIVTVRKNGCEDTDTVKVTVESQITNPPPSEANAGDDISICLGESITLNASGGDSYIWSNGDVKKSIQVNPIRTTTYSLSATRGGITSSDSVIVTVENCNNSSSENDFNTNLVIYPNPSSGIIHFNLNSSHKDLNLIIFNLNGSIIYSDKINSNQNGFTKQINLSRFTKGVYFVRLFNSNQNIVKKVLLI